MQRKNDIFMQIEFFPSNMQTDIASLKVTLY